MHQYLRGITYNNAMRFIEKFQELGGEANITVGGVSASGEEQVWLDVIEWLHSEGIDYEFTSTHPDTIRKRIIKKLGAQEVSKN